MKKLGSTVSVTLFCALIVVTMGYAAANSLENDDNSNYTTTVHFDLIPPDETNISVGNTKESWAPLSVFYPDDREKVVDTTSFPWSTICKVYTYHPSGETAVGTAFMVDENHALTAGHLLYLHDEDGWAYDSWAESIKIVPAMSNGMEPFGHAWGTYMQSETGWTDYQDEDYDWGLITLDEDIGGYTGWMGVETAPYYSSIYSGTLNTAGYPTDLDSGTSMYYCSGDGKDADQYLHYHYLDTKGGQSGSPIWRYDGENRYVLSINAYGSSSYNIATRIDQHKFDTLQDWLETDTSDQTLYVGGSGPENYTIIQNAINDASSGDTIYVYNGTYYENVVIDKTVDLIGEGRNGTVIDASYSGSPVRLSADFVNISHFTMTHSGEGGNQYAGIDIDSDHNCIYDCLIRNNSEKGILAWHTNYNTIDSCFIYDNDEQGMAFGWDCHYATLKNSYIENDWVKAADPSSNIKIINCIVNKAGINIQDAVNCQIKNCLINNSPSNGIAVDYWTGSGHDNIVENNTISNCLGHGIWVERNDYIIITDNNIESNTGYGVYIDSNSDSNNIYHNNFVNNNGGGIQGYDAGANNQWHNGYPSGGNYWSDYDEASEGAYDNNSDGIVDTPYNISGGDNQDLYPLMEPWNATPTTVYVDDAYDTSTPGWQYDHFDSIQDGIDAVAENGTVHVFKGTYYENVVVDKSINLIGENKSDTIIDGGDTDDVLYVSTDGVTIAGFTVQNSGIYSGDEGIELDNVQNCTIKNNTIANNKEVAGIHLSFSSTNTITDNIITNNYEGISLSLSLNNIIKGNTVINNSDDGIHIFTSDSNITGNIVTNNEGDGIYLYSSDDCFITNNTITNNSNYGLNLYLSDNNIIFNNFFNNTQNVRVVGTNIWNTSKTLGVNIIGGPYLGGNYWGNYKGVDMDGDGLGDTNIPHGPGDWLPLTNSNYAPSASFRYAPVNPSTADTIYFNSTSTDSDGSIVNWTWDMGDGTTMYGENITYNYTDDGSYTVTLTVTDDDGAIDTASQMVNISNVPPSASFTVEPSSPSTADMVYFNSTSWDTDGNIVNWTWQMGDGTILYGEKITHSYLDDGSYNVMLTVTDNDGVSDTATDMVAVSNEPPSASFTIEPAMPFPADTIYFNSTSNDSDGDIVNITWSLGDGSTLYGEQVTHSYIDDGNYTVELVATDDDGATDIKSTMVTVVNEPPAASFTLKPSHPDTDQMVYFNSTSIDSDGNIVSWQWEMGDGTILQGEQITHAYADNGDYQVNLTVTDDDGDTNQTTATIQVQNRPPVPHFTIIVDDENLSVSVNASASFDPDGDIVNFSWDWTDDGSFDSYGATVNHTYPSYGQYTVTLRVKDDDDEYNTSSTEIVINEAPTANFTWSPRTQYRPRTGEAVTFDATNSTDPDGTISVYKWDWDHDGVFDESVTTATVEHSWPDNGSYPVVLRVEDDAGGNDSIQKIVVLYNRAPSVSFSFYPDMPETGEQVSFTSTCSDPDGQIQSYSWSFGDGASSSQTHPGHTYTQSGTYTITLTIVDDDGSASSASQSINVNSPPTANFSYTPEQPSDLDTIHFTSLSTDGDGSIVNTTWNLGDGNLSYTSDPSHQYLNNGTYRVKLTVTDDDGATDHTTKTISVENVEPSINFTCSREPPVTVNKTVNFTDKSSDPDGSIVSWEWNFDDGTTAYGNKVNHSFTQPRNYTVSLTVADNDGATASHTMSIKVEKKEEGGIPGFEFILLLAAAGVAIFLVRRRYNEG